MELKEGYKNTEVGVIPEDWNVILLDDYTKRGSGHTPSKKYKEYYDGDIVWVSLADSNKLDNGLIKSSTITISSKGIANSSAVLHPEGIVLMSRDAGIGKSAVAGCPLCVSQHFITWLCKDDLLNNWFLYYWLQFKKSEFERIAIGSTIKTIGLPYFKSYKIPTPKIEEQKAIAQVLSDTDALIQALEKKIAKKKLIKKGVMQKLLTPKEGWILKTIEEIADCLDNKRIPLNGDQRTKIKGHIPYCGANGIVDYINDYVIDDDIILMAEDGGYFDEYDIRPIAYRLIGKCWVNNHAHILKAKEDISQGFLFYSLVHKNILDYINAGTRSKLNKGEMFKIEIPIPNTIFEQNQISQTLSDIDKEIEVLEHKLAKYQLAKQGMMQQLLTGKIRLVKPNPKEKEEDLAIAAEPNQSYIEK